MSGRRAASLTATLVAVAAFVWLVMQQSLWAKLLEALFPGVPQPVFTGGTLAQLTGQHLAIVGIASALTILVGIPLAVWVTRPSGRDFRELVDAAVDFGQTFPPVAVLALMLPILGLGLRPSVVALFLYGLFPVVSSTIAGIDAVPAAVLDAANGVGMGRWRILLMIELPMAARVIMAGVRTSVIISIGTATVAAVVGAGGLGSPIIGGIQVQNTAWVFEGALTAALLAILADALLVQAEIAVTPRGLRAD